MRDRAPEDVLREEQEDDATKAQRQAEDHIGYEEAARFDAEQAERRQGPGLDEYAGTEAEKAQQEADHQRDVEQDREMMTEDPEPHCSCNSAGQDPNCHIDHTRSIAQLREAFPPAVGLGLPHYNEDVYGIGGILNYSYWNTNGVAMCIVAKEGGAADWAAYVGATNAANNSEEDTVQWVCRNGAKLSRKQANRWFSELPIEAYRE